VVPVCFALVGTAVVTPIDEKPQRVDPGALRRVRDVEIRTITSNATVSRHIDQ